MATTIFTTRIDLGLKERLQKIAELDQRSASYMANKAIEQMVEEREAMRSYIETGVMLADKGIGISEQAMDAWMEGPIDAPFPEPDSFK